MYGAALPITCNPKNRRCMGFGVPSLIWVREAGSCAITQALILTLGTLLDRQVHVSTLNLPVICEPLYSADLFLWVREAGLCIQTSSNFWTGTIFTRLKEISLTFNPDKATLSKSVKFEAGNDQAYMAPSRPIPALAPRPLEAAHVSAVP